MCSSCGSLLDLVAAATLVAVLVVGLVAAAVANFRPLKLLPQHLVVAVVAVIGLIWPAALP